MAVVPHLSDKSIVVLTHIAQGQSYSQIVDSHPEISYLDIFKAAEEALRLNECLPDHQMRLAQIKNQHARAYAPWSDEEDGELIAMHGHGRTTAEIAAHLERQPSAIRSRLSKLGLV